MSTYDFSKPTNYLSRRMFLDGRVTVQRFEEVRYPKIEKFNDTAEGFFWRPQEITLMKDKTDFKEASDAVRHIFTSNLLRQTALDSIQGRGPTQVFTPIASIPELELLFNNWGFFEANIHSKAYSWIIRNIYGQPKDEFNKIHDTVEIVQMAARIGEHYDELHRLNSLIATGQHVHEELHVDAIWMALNASYALEAIRFMVSFATSLGMVENKIFIGNGNIISLILQDELLHKDWTAYIINQCVKDDDRFKAAKERCKDKAYQLYLDVIAEEKAWADYLFKKGVVIGLNAQIMKDFVDWTAIDVLKAIGVKYTAVVPKSNPLPWFNKHSNTSMKQTALQENESTAYVIGALDDELDLSTLPTL
jgi:ribonucleoside-diphosphate reductase beta chain